MVENHTKAGAKKALNELIEAFDADFFLFSGPLNYANAAQFIDMVEKTKSRSNVVLVLATFGGEAGSAYRIARFLKQNYAQFNLFVFGFCKSAGTLIALGADQIIMGKRGEFGPLDVQLIKTDEFTEMSSGLDVSIALDVIGNHAFAIFEKVLLELKNRSAGAITTRTAAEIAKSMAVGLLAPITDQIDPLKLGETQRAMKIAHQYGLQLHANEKLLKHLTEDYPSHDFVIDLDEAKSLFKCVRGITDLEERFEAELRTLLKPKGLEDSVRIPSDSKCSMGPLKLEPTEPPAKHEKPNENHSTGGSDGNGRDPAHPLPGDAGSALGDHRDSNPSSTTSATTAKTRTADH